MKYFCVAKNLISTMIAALLFLVLASLAPAAEVTVENNTGQAIKEINLSETTMNLWQDNLLEPDTAIGPAESASVNLDADSGKMDLRARLDDGSEEIYPNIDFRDVSRIRLNSRGTVEIN